MFQSIRFSISITVEWYSIAVTTSLCFIGCSPCGHTPSDDYYPTCRAFPTSNSLKTDVKIHTKMEGIPLFWTSPEHRKINEMIVSYSDSMQVSWCCHFCPHRCVSLIFSFGFHHLDCDQNNYSQNGLEYMLVKIITDMFHLSVNHVERVGL